MNENNNITQMFVWGGLCLFIGILFQLLVHLRRKRCQEPEEPLIKKLKEVEKNKLKQELTTTQDGDSGKSSDNQQPAAKQTKKRGPWKSKSDYSHPWLLKTLKGHNGRVLHMDLSGNGKFLASTCDERSVMLWDIRDLSGAPEFRSLRINIEYDHGSFVSWSPDSRGFALHRARENCIELYRIQKRKNGVIGSAQKTITYEKAHEGDVIGFGVSPNKQFIMSCSNKTDVVIWDLRGNILTRFDTYLMNNTRAKISPCGRFIVATGFSPDVKVMEVVFKGGELKGVNKAFDLTSHSAAVNDVDFDADSSHIVTVSNDSTWNLYFTNIEYTKGESPRVVSSGQYESSSSPALIALSPDALVVALATYNTIYFYDASNGKLYDQLDEVFDSEVTCMKFDPTGHYLFVSGSKYIRIFHNVVGYVMRAKDSQNKLKAGNLTSATKERLQGVISECKQFIATLPK